MTPDERPRLADFENRLGESFTASTPGGSPAGAWLLVACKPLPRPDLPQLAGRDCFSLAFRGMTGLPQDTYRLVATDGYATTLFAVPVAADEMHVTVN